MKTLSEAEARRTQLIDEVQTIQTQLGARNKTNADGSRLAPQDYWDWRNKAATALRHKTTELRNVNQWIKEHRRRLLAPTTAGSLDPSDPTALIQAAWTLLRKLASEEVAFDPEEQAVVDALRAHLSHHAQV